MLQRLSRPFFAFVKNEDGPTAVEYAVMLALIIVVCIAAIGTLGTNANTVFSNVVLMPLRALESAQRSRCRSIFAKVVILLASIVMVVIRAPHGQRSRTIPVVRSRKGRLEIVLLTMACVAFFLPPFDSIATPCSVTAYGGYRRPPH